MVLAARAKKCARPANVIGADPSQRTNSSLTSALGSSVCRARTVLDFASRRRRRLGRTLPRGRTRHRTVRSLYSSSGALDGVRCPRGVDGNACNRPQRTCSGRGRGLAGPPRALLCDHARRQWCPSGHPSAGSRGSPADADRNDLGCGRRVRDQEPSRRARRSQRSVGRRARLGRVDDGWLGIRHDARRPSVGTCADPRRDRQGPDDLGVALCRLPGGRAVRAALLAGIADLVESPATRTTGRSSRRFARPRGHRRVDGDERDHHPLVAAPAGLAA